jgi:1,2-dihydroxy-3-keto-5-methylthiopentene dioxygenase
MKAHWLERTGEIPAQELTANGVYYEKLSTDEGAYQAALDRLRKERGYIEQDVIALAPQTPNLETICAKFIPEHYHDDDEVRFVLQGEGIFDIRSRDDQWMRVTVEPGDLIVVPKERHHRFMLTETKTIRCVRLFKDQSGWVPHYRQ